MTTSRPSGATTADRLRYVDVAMGCTPSDALAVSWYTAAVVVPALSVAPTTTTFSRAGLPDSMASGSAPGAAQPKAAHPAPAGASNATDSRSARGSADQ